MKLKQAAIWIFLLVIVIFAAYAGMLIFVAWPINEWSVSKAGVFGDSFGVVNALFSGLAFAGLIITILLQRQELSESREIFKAQKFDDAFYRLLDFYKKNLNEISIADSDEENTHIGIGGLTYLLKKLSHANQEYIHYTGFADTEIIYKYYMYKEIQRILMPQSRYLGTIESILALIQNDIDLDSDRRFYIKILASQLTVHEVKYLFYQCLVAQNHSSLRELIHDTKLLQMRITECNISKTLINLYSEMHGVELPHGKDKPELPYTRAEIRKIRKKHKQLLESAGK